MKQCHWCDDWFDERSHPSGDHDPYCSSSCAVRASVDSAEDEEVEDDEEEEPEVEEL